MENQRFTLSTRIARPAAEVFAWHERPGALARLCPPWERIEIVASSGGIREGAQVTVRNKVGPFWLNWDVVHRDYRPGVEFRDEQVRGPFAHWEHLHRVEADGPEACVLTDEIHYRLPGGAVGKALAGGTVRRKLERAFAWRHATTKADMERSAQYGAVRPRKIVIAGASGLLGRVLVPYLQTQGHTVVRLVRRPGRGLDELFWNPAKGELDAAALEGSDVIINLAGENVGAGRWTAARRAAILRSRVDTTRTLVLALKKLSRKPEVLVNASATGFYGDRGDEVLADDASIGQGFLPEVCLAWETHAEGAARLGVRTALLRFGVVLTPAGGALAKLLPAFRAGLGGRLGDGRQWMSWVSIDDVVDAIYRAVLDPRWSGAANVTAPNPVTNAEFTATLGRRLRRPTVLPVPGWVLRAAFDRMADEALLASARAVPERLQAMGHTFRHPTLETALGHLLP